MSFSSTPLHQNRRLDHNTFHKKPPSNGQRSVQEPLPPTSYSYGAPTSGSRSPPKPSSPARPNDDDELALAQFARIKQRDLASRHGGPKTFTAPPNPETWSVKDTSVNIASAFQQAATDMSNPNSSWASSSSRPANVPRGTSVEYESQAQQATRRLAPPPPKGLRATTQRKPPSKTPSYRHVPDSEGEEDRTANGRGKSPFDAVIDSAKRAVHTATYYVQKMGPGEPSKEKDPSYDYEAEEQEFQNSQISQISTQAPAPRRKNHLTGKRSSISLDNKAYQPGQSDEEESEEESENEGKPRRKKKKKKDTKGLTLPVISPDKQRKRRAKGSKGNPAEEEEVEEEPSGSEANQSTERISAQRAIEMRNSQPPDRQPSFPRASIPRDLRPHNEPDASMDIEQGLDSIPEVDEDDVNDIPSHQTQQQQRRSVSRGPPPAWSIGRVLGRIVKFVTSMFRMLGVFTLTFFTGLFYLIGGTFGTLLVTLILRPFEWVYRAPVAKYMVLGLILSSIFVLREPLLYYVPSGPRISFPRSHTHTPVYTPPDVPAADISELAARLQRIEIALASLTREVETARLKTEGDARTQMEVLGRLGALESRVALEARRASEAEVQVGKTAKEGLGIVRQEVEVLQAHFKALQQKQTEQQHQHQQQPPTSSGKEREASDQEARVRLGALEKRVGSVEGGVHEALELGKKALSTISTSNDGPSAVTTAWWNKLAAGDKSGITIKSSDGQDVISLIEHLVDAAVYTHSKDTLGRPDFALHSGGARVIPSLSSPTFEMRPDNVRGTLLGLITGNGHAIGRPPVTALHHELHNGHCWPFAGHQGQLGVALAAPTYVSEISIDHVAREVAFDMRSAPREMEVWGMVEGKDNIAKVREWMAERERKREEKRALGEEVEEDPEYPKTLPRAPQYVRIAKFTYNIHGGRNVQTFPVDEEVRALGVDFGIVVLNIKSNWGREEFTCLYRMRVHGQRMGETPLPYPEEISA
ncbi:hypothetical protein DXG03_004722 [Asterophora parasitica]|uniref:SUN domain-containing protein n=1 Tax=Asterophora parasitica TaxID=117018 RepID=A0A9P7GC01_9AGAR|nr:hypothetical protein DXG03_004722 [Asterophora parasitica]